MCIKLQGNLHHPRYEPYVIAGKYPPQVKNPGPEDQVFNVRKNIYDVITESQIDYKISMGVPKAWEETCVRQGSGYLNSNNNGPVLILS